MIVDVCSRHGIWFDAEKLSCILDWVRSGGLAAANEESLAKATRDAQVEERLIRERLADSPASAHDYHNRDHDLLGRAIDLLGSIFGR